MLLIEIVWKIKTASAIYDDKSIIKLRFFYEIHVYNFANFCWLYNL